MKPKVGIAGALELLEGLDPATRERILAEVREKEPGLYEQLQSGLPHFESLIDLDEQRLRKLFGSIPRQKWARALRACSPELNAKLMACLPARARKELEEEIRAVGPQPLDEVRRIQFEIALEAATRFGRR